jgi:hypothetical protein
MGLAYYSVDLREAQAEKQAAQRIAARFVPSTPEGKRWCLGSWALQYYSGRAGFEPAVPDRTRLNAGDVLMVRDPSMSARALALSPDQIQPLDRIVISDALPVRTVTCFYGGRTPLEHHEGPRVAVSVYRVQSDCILKTAHDERPVLPNRANPPAE